MSREPCDPAWSELALLYNMALGGELPGGVRRFEEWLMRVCEDALKALEEDGLVMSYVDDDGRRIYYPTPSVTKLN